MWLSLGQGIVLVSMMLWTAIVARYIGPQTYGTYAYAQSTITILLIFVNLGLDQLLVRDVAQKPQAGWAYLTGCLLIRLALCVAILGGFLFTSVRRGGPSEWMALISILTVNSSAITIGALAMAMLYAREAMARAVIAQVANAVLTLATGAVAVWQKQPFTVVLLLSLAATVVQVAIGYWYVARTYGAARVSDLTAAATARAISALLAKALPFAALGILATLQNHLIVLLLGSRAQHGTLVGFFAAANRIHLMTLIVPEKLSHAILPAFSRVRTESPQRFAPMFEQAYRYIFLVTAPMAIGLWVISPDILNLIYGAEFSPAAGSLRILSLVLLTSAGYVMGPAMAAMNRQNLLAGIWGATLAVMAGIGYWAIPRYGAEGASWTVLAGTLIGFVTYSTLLFRWLSLPYPVRWMAKALLAALGMGMATSWLVQRISFLLVAAVISPLVYVLFLLLSGALSLEDRQRLVSLLPAPLTHRLATYGERVLTLLR